MPRRSDAQDWCYHFLPWFAAWCGALTLAVTILVAFPNRSKTCNIIFAVISSVASLIWHLVACILVAGKRRQEQKDRDIEAYFALDQRRKAAFDREGQNSANEAIVKVFKNGVVFNENTKQYETFKSNSDKLKTLVKQSEKFESDRKAEKKAREAEKEERKAENEEMSEKISNVNDNVNNLALQVIKSNHCEAQNNLEAMSQYSKSLSALQ